MFGPDPLSDPASFLALWIIIVAAWEFANSPVPFV
jgi:hypothetical protein